MLGPQAAETMAERVGEEYGRRLAGQMSPAESQRSVRTAMHAIADTLTAHGFAAHAEDQGATTAVVADNCPFGDAATQHPVLCAVDRGMVKGLLAGLCGDDPGPCRSCCRRPVPGATTPAPPWSDADRGPPLPRPRLHHPAAPRGPCRHGRVGRPRRTADPGRVHTEGRLVRATFEDARDRVADLFGVRPRQVVLTSVGPRRSTRPSRGAGRPTPARRWPGRGRALGRPCRLGPPRHDRGGRCRRPGPDHRAAVGEAVERCAALHGRTPALVHCQVANHEVGTPPGRAEVVARCREAGVPVHVDAVAAAGHVPLDLDALGADLVSVSPTSSVAPPAWVRSSSAAGLRIDPLLVGGEQERGRRAGLEDVAGAVGFGAAAAALAGRDASSRRRRPPADATGRLLEAPSPSTASSPRRRHRPGAPHRLPRRDGVEAEPVVLGLDQAGVAVHSGSSCSSESLEPSPVLQAMGVDGERSLRLSVGWSTTDADVDAFAGAFGGVVGRRRACGPERLSRPPGRHRR